MNRFVPKKTWDLDLIGTAKSQRIPTKTRLKIPNPTHKHQNFDPKVPYFCNFLVKFGLGFRASFSDLGFFGKSFGNFWARISWYLDVPTQAKTHVFLGHQIS